MRLCIYYEGSESFNGSGSSRTVPARPSGEGSLEASLNLYTSDTFFVLKGSTVTIVRYYVTPTSLKGSVTFSENVFRLLTVCLQDPVLHYVNKYPF
jgi:hypothetical protein